MITAADALKGFLSRPEDSHKGSFGRLLVVAGSQDMPGAAILALEGALRGGAGLITLGALPSVLDLASARLPDILRLPLPATDEGTITQHAAPVALARAEGMTAALVGPGMSRVPLTRQFVAAFASGTSCPLVIDADGLNAVADEDLLDNLANRKAPTILTPHPGEIRRLGASTDQHRVEQARALASRSKSIVVLKGHRTLVAEPDGAVGVCLTGSPALARGGTGDVLAGLLASLLARGVPAANAARSAVYLHGLAGEALARSEGEHMAPAGLVAGALPAALREARSRADQDGGSIDTSRL